MHEVIIQMLDGTEERYQTANPLALPGGVLMIDTGNGNYIAISLSQIKRWEFKAGRVVVPSAGPPPPGARPLQ
jgi:hypothetical protein